MGSVPIDLIVSLWVGLLFAACARKQLRDGAGVSARFWQGPLMGWELIAVLAFVAIVRWPVALYEGLVHADWSLLYLVDPARLPSVTSAIVLVAHLACVLGGYGGGVWLVRRRLDHLLFASVGAVAVVACAIAFGCRARLGTYTSYANFHSGHRVPLSEGRLPWLLLVTWAGESLAVAATGWMLWSQGRLPAGPNAVSKIDAAPRPPRTPPSLPLDTEAPAPVASDS